MIGFPKKELTGEKSNPKTTATTGNIKGIAFPHELWEKVRAEAEHRHITLSGFVRQCVVEYFDRKGA